jgi:hypothetical protein
MILSVLPGPSFFPENDFEFTIANIQVRKFLSLQGKEPVVKEMFFRIKQVRHISGT